MRLRKSDAAARRVARAVAPGSLVIFGVPLLVHPYAWAKAFGWKEEPVTDVGLYFGRCLGALAVALGGDGVRAAQDPRRHRGFFDVGETAGWLLAAVHLRGMLEGRQPPIEHAEIAGYSALALLVRRVRPSA
jgi:hypothetical protein